MSASTIPPTLLRLWLARIASKLAICGAMTYDLYQLSQIRGKDGALKKGIGSDAKRTLRKHGKAEKSEGASSATAEDVFIRSLVSAGECRHYASKRWELSHRWRQEQHRRPQTRVDKRLFSNRSAPGRMFGLAAPDPSSPKLGKEMVPPSIQEAVRRHKLRELVNTYDSPSDLWEEPKLNPRKPHYPLAPRLVLTPEQEDSLSFAGRRILRAEDLGHESQLRHLYALLRLEFGTISLTRLWESYRALRSPRVRYIPDNKLRLLFSHLSYVEFANASPATSWYLSLLDECVGEGVPVLQREWNTAISFAGRRVRLITTDEIKDAVDMWMKMENSGVGADNVTFNILFDVAVKAGRFALADTIYHELKSRGMELNRYFRTSVIYFAGLRGDGDGVRQAFRELVDSGDVADNTVMNCVILSLIRAGEHAAAENVFAKMKRLHEDGLGTDSPQGWIEQRKKTAELDQSAHRWRMKRAEHEASFFGSSFSTLDEREMVQRASPIAPDERTYRILIEHHADKSGDLPRVDELLKEARTRRLRVHGSVYVHIFRGFWVHGGHAYTAWSRARLQEIWAEFLAVSHTTSANATAESDDGGDDVEASGASEVDDKSLKPEQFEQDKRPYMTRSLAVAVLRAFYKCVGRKKMVEVWAVVKQTWPARSYDDELYVQQLVDKLVREDSVFII